LEEKVDKTSNTNINTELAKHRTHEASDRTMMAWVRTSLALMGFGVGIYEVAEKTGGQQMFRSSRLVGIFLILLSLIAMVFAISENKQNHKKLQDPEFKYVNKESLGVKVGYALIVIAVFALINFISKFFS